MISLSVHPYGTAKYYWFPPLSRLCRRQALAVEVVSAICASSLQPRLRLDPDLILLPQGTKPSFDIELLVLNITSTVGTTTLISDSLQ
jgi:hypothetical protein